MIPRFDGVVKRRLQAVVGTRLREEPVLALHGPRTVGKSTLLTDVATATGSLPIDLDDGAVREAAQADPAFFVSGPAPVCIDEYQHVPEVLSAIKAELNRDLRPGRFILTGSTTYSSIPLTAQSLTGRLHVMTLWPLSQGEIEGRQEVFVERIFQDPSDLLDPTPSVTARAEYAERIFRGGMPLALPRSPAARGRWFDDYVTLVVERDVMELARVRQRESLPRLLRALASQTAQLLVVRRAAEAAGLEASTAENYTKLLEAAFLVHRLPPWGTTLRSRVSKAPKLHMFDSGLAARLLRLTPARIDRREPAALTEFGHVLETFVVNEILKQASWLEERVDAGHFRAGNDEVDLVLEAPDGSVVGVEVKASGRVGAGDFGGLRALQSAIGDRFRAGILLHLGQRSFTSGPSLYALPVDRLWTATA